MTFLYFSNIFTMSMYYFYNMNAYVTRKVDKALLALEKRNQLTNNSRTSLTALANN